VDRIAGSKKENWLLTACSTQPGKNLPAIQAGNHHVQNNQVELHFLPQAKSLQTVSRYIDGKTCFSQTLLQELGGFDFIFND
jgi:hypothetical protein